MYLVDTDTCVDALRGLPSAVEGLAAFEGEGPLVVSSVTAHELWQGAFGAREPDASCQAVARFLSAFQIMAYDAGVAREGGRLAAGLAARGRAIGDLDTMIAATALAHDAVLVTRNVRHFGRVPGLRLRAP